MTAAAVALQIAGALLGPLVQEIGEGIAEGLDEEAATRRALERLARAPIPEPLVPRVRALVETERAR